MTDATRPAFHMTRFDDEARRNVGSQSHADRKRMIDTLHVDHPAFEEGYEFVRDLHYPVGSGLVGRGDMKMLVGNFRSGKTRIVERYAADVAAQRGDASKTPVLHVECTANWTAKNVMVDAMEQLTGLTQSDRPTMTMLTKLASEMIKRFGVELFVVDDVGWVLGKGEKAAAALLTNLRKIQTSGLCSLLLVGSAATHRSIEKGHPYIGRLRHHEVAGMDWHGGGMSDYMMYLDEMDELLPFPRKAGLGTPRYAPYFYDLSAGSPAFTGLYVRDAAERALREGTDRIEHRHLVAMGKKATSVDDPFTPFVDRLDPKLVGRRETVK